MFNRIIACQNSAVISSSGITDIYDEAYGVYLSVMTVGWTILYETIYTMSRLIHAHESKAVLWQKTR